MAKHAQDAEAVWGSDVDDPPGDVRLRLQRVLMVSDLSREKEDYEFLDRYIHSVTYFSDLPPRDRLRYLRMAKGIELDKGEELFHMGDSADAFYCIMYGSLNVVVDLTQMAATLNEFDEIISRARIHSTLLNPGRTLDVTNSTSYTVRCMKRLECFGDVGLLTSDQLRTASVVANERTLCMKIDRETFLDLRKQNSDRELREKIRFISSVSGFEHWDADGILRLVGRMERVRFSYNDVVMKEGEPAGDVFFVKHGECRLVKRYPTLRLHQQTCFVEIFTVGSRHYFGTYEAVNGVGDAEFSVLVSSPTATLYRVDRVDFRQTVLKDAITEQMLRNESVELTLRLDLDSVRQDLERDLNWGEYKRQVVHQVLDKHQREHTSALIGPRSPRPFHCVQPPGPMDGIQSRSVRLASPRQSAHSVRVVVAAPGSLDANNAKRRPGRRSRWLEWAKHRAHELVNGHDGLANEATNSDPRSNIHWGTSSRIMGGLDVDGTKITSAIVSIFNPNEPH